MMLRRTLLALVVAPLAASTAQVSGDSLHPITLQEAVTMAQRNAPAAVQARGQLRTTSSAVRSAYGAFLPSLSSSAGQSKQNGERFDPLRGPVAGQYSPWQYSTGLNSNLEIFDGFRRWNDLKTRKADVDAAEANETSQKFSIALQVKREYANILAARESETAARAQIEQAQAQLTASSARVRAGAATVSDSLRSVIALGNARLALLTAQNSVRVGSATLTRLVGAPFLVTANPADTAGFTVTAIDSTELAALARQGPAVQQAEKQYASAHTAARSSRSTYLPTISLSYRYSGNRTDSSYQVTFGPYAFGSTFSVNLSYPLFNNFNREDQVLRAKVSEDNSAANLREARLLAQQNLIQQIGALRTAEERIQIQQVSVAAAQEDLRVQQQRYALGASTLLDLLTSQSQLNGARAALIQARQDYRIARAQLEALIGRDLQ